MKHMMARFVREEEGQDLIEYALLAAFVSLAVTGAMQFLAASIASEYNAVATSVTAGGS